MPQARDIKTGEPVELVVIKADAELLGCTDEERDALRYTPARYGSYNETTDLYTVYTLTRRWIELPFSDLSFPERENRSRRFDPSDRGHAHGVYSTNNRPD